MPCTWQAGRTQKHHQSWPIEQSNECQKFCSDVAAFERKSWRTSGRNFGCRIMWMIFSVDEIVSGSSFRLTLRYTSRWEKAKKKHRQTLSLKYLLRNKPSIFEKCYLQIGFSGWLTGHYNFRCQPVDYSNHPNTLRVIFLLQMNIKFLYLFSFLGVNNKTASPLVQSIS